MHRDWLLAICLLAAGLLPATAAAQTPPSAAGEFRHWRGEMDNGNVWKLDMPADWNGTVILVSHGYDPGPGRRPRHSLDNSLHLQEKLLERGFAMLGSSYSANGWAVEEGVVDQKAVLDMFAAHFGMPDRVIAFGRSMGGLVSIALLERWPERITGALPVCASASGATPMMNVALDGMFAFKTLLAPDLTIVNAADERAERTRAQTALDDAQSTTEGRARIALAAALAQLPGWTESNGAGDADAVQRRFYETFLWGAMLPRSDQERRAGGNFSWNTGDDYRALLARSGHADMVRRLYDKAGLDLDADLERLNAAPRISADPDAVAYMDANYVPTGDLHGPVLLMHTLGDGMTSPSLTSGLVHRAEQAGRGHMVRRLFVARNGHCSFTPAELETALDALLARLETGEWPDLSAHSLNAEHPGGAAGTTAFSDTRPPAMTRP